MRDEEKMRDVLVRYLNNHDSLEELILSHAVVKCSECNNYVLEEDMEDTEGKLNGSIGKVCSQCYKDLDIGR